MKADVFQRALLATARVACCVSLFAGCHTPAPQEPTYQTEPVPTTQTGSTVDSTAPVEDCQAHVAAVFTDKTQSQTEQTTQCCLEIAKEYDKKNIRALGSDWQESTECCRLIDFQTRGCYPWGPPCPPSMPS
jgi:hypothetical protein